MTMREDFEAWFAAGAKLRAMKQEHDAYEDKIKTHLKHRPIVLETNESFHLYTLASDGIITRQAVTHLS